MENYTNFEEVSKGNTVATITAVRSPTLIFIIASLCNIKNPGQGSPVPTTGDLNVTLGKIQKRSSPLK